VSIGDGANYASPVDYDASVSVERSMLKILQSSRRQATKKFVMAGLRPGHPRLF
jgi:hypothetical protein